MISSVYRRIPALVCVGASLTLVACNESGGDVEPEAASASTSVNLASTTDRGGRDEAVPTSLAAADVKKPDATSPPPASPNKPTTQPTLVSDKHIVIAEPAALELGQIPTGENKTGTVTLRNTGDRPMKLGKPKSSCGCTAVQQIAGKTIDAGESLDVEIRMKGGTAARALNKTVTFVVEGQPPLVVKVNAEAISYVEVDPSVVGPESTPDGKITLRSIDETPFKIINMMPPVIEEFPDEAQPEVELTLPWDRFEELGMRHKVVFDTDHPKCQKVYLTVSFDRSKYAPPRPQPDAATTTGSLAPGSLVSSYIQRGQTAEVVAMVEKGEVEIDARDGTGASLLGQAAKAGHVELVNALVEAGADIEANDKAGRTPLMAASEAKNANVIRALLDAGASLEARDNIGGTALSWAAAFGDAESVMALIDAGADVRVVGMATGYTPLIWAAGFGEPGSVEALLEVGAEVGTSDLLEGLTPLMHAARTGKAESITVLIENGADVHATDRVGRTALLTAAANSGGTVEKLEILVDAGADLSAKDKRGESALDMARRRTDINAPPVVEYLESIMDESD